MADIAVRPPMGWNSFDCLGYTAGEAEVKAVADYMAQNLREYGWEYVVIDWCWYAPLTGSVWPPMQDESFEPRLITDEYGRFLPCEDRFPSAANGQGFKALADYVHSKGLKFGVHIIRGIPRQSVAEKAPVLGTSVTAADIAWVGSSWGEPNCTWGIKMQKPGAQEYLDSVFKLYAEWGVDYVKIDDLTKNPYSRLEIEGYRKAIDSCGRPMVFSGSPGETKLRYAAHASAHMNMWRLLEDVWGKWEQVDHAFDVIPKWLPYQSAGHWPDPDMLPLGKLIPGWESTLTHDEQRTLVTLWCITRSPLIVGGYLPENDDFVTSLITNPEVIAVDQESCGSRVVRGGRTPVYCADVPGTSDIYLAAFNREGEARTISVPLGRLGMSACAVRDLWAREDVGVCREKLQVSLDGHGCGLYRLSFDQ